MSGNVLTILGSSSALPTSQRFPSAQVLQIFGRFFLIDCGEGAQLQLRRSRASFSKIKAICISHMHADHYLGIFGILASFNLLGRKHALTIYGPKELKEMISFHISYLDFPLNFEIIFIPLIKHEKTLLYKDNKISIYSFPLEHRKTCWGFEFIEHSPEFKIKKDVFSLYNLGVKQILDIKKGEDVELENGETIKNSNITIPPKPVSYVYITDTRFLPQLAEEITPPTLLYHEATFDKNMQKRAVETYHSTSIQAAEFAEICKAEKLIIGHFSARYKNVDSLLDEAREIFSETYAAEDLQSFTF